MKIYLIFYIFFISYITKILLKSILYYFYP